MKAELKATATGTAIVAQINGDHGAGDVQVFTIDEAEVAVMRLRNAVAAAKQAKYEATQNVFNCVRCGEPVTGASAEVEDGIVCAECLSPEEEIA